MRTAIDSTLLFLCAALACASCGGPAKPIAPSPPPRPVDEDIADLAPAGFAQMARVDLKRLRASALWRLSDTLSAHPTVERSRAQTGVDLLVEVDEALFVGTDRPNGGEDELLAIVKGGFDAKGAVARVLASNGGEPVELGEGGATNGSLVLVPVTGRTLLFGTRAAVERALSLASGTGSSIKDEARFGDVALGDNEVAIARYRRGEAPPDLRRYSRSPIGKWRWLASVSSLDASLEAGTETRLAATLILDAEGDAKRARRDISRTVRGFSRNAVLAFMGLARFLEPLKVGGEGASVTFDYHLDAGAMADLAALAQRLDRIRELLGGGEEDGVDADEEDEEIELDPPLLQRKKPAPPSPSRGSI